MYNRTDGTQNNSAGVQSRANAASGQARSGNTQGKNNQGRPVNQTRVNGAANQGPARTVNRGASQQRAAGGFRQQYRQSNSQSAAGTNTQKSVNRDVSAISVARNKNISKKEALNRFIKRINKTSAEAVKGTLSEYKTVVRRKDIVREEGSIDYVFLVLVLILVAFGTVMVYSASYAYAKSEYNDSYHFLFRQCVFIAVGAVGMFVASRLDPRKYIALSPLAYAICALAMVAVLFVGTKHGGARRWIDIGFTEIQPSEFMKLGLIMLLACYVDINYEKITDRNNLFGATVYGTLIPMVITGFTCVLVIVQPHLSGAIIMFLIGVIMIYMSGSPMHLLGVLSGIGAAAFLVVGLVTPYMKTRLSTWFHPENDSQGTGYQTLQGLYAIGSGGLFGEGLGNSYQKHHFVSQPQNDFIYTILCEELGFVGAIAVIVLFIMLIWRGIKIAMKATDVFSTMLVLGIVGKLALQTILNIGVVTNTLPNTGVSLPFFSYGGSSLVVAMVEMGMVLSISRYSKISK